MSNVSEETVFQEAALSDSVIFQSYNRNGEMTQTLVAAIKDSTLITEEHIKFQIETILRTRYTPLAEEMIEEFRNGNIILMYSNGVKKVPTALPFFVTRLEGKIKAIVFVNNYGTLSRVDQATGAQAFDIAVKDLYVLLEGALTAYRYTVYPSKINRSLGLMRIACNVYTQMFLRILNKEHAISMDVELNDKVTFCIAKFFLQSVWGFNNENVIISYARSMLRTAMNSAELMALSDEYDTRNIRTVEDLIGFIRDMNPRLKTLNFRYFVQWYINMYKAGALFGLECLPYFLYTVQAAMVGSFLVNQPIITDITKNIKGMNTFYPELVKAISI